MDWFIGLVRAMSSVKLYASGVTALKMVPALAVPALAVPALAATAVLAQKPLQTRRVR